MKFNIGDSVFYENLSGKIIGFWKNTEQYKNVFEAEFKVDDTIKVVLFDKDGCVKPLNEISNQDNPKVFKK